MHSQCVNDFGTDYWETEHGIVLVSISYLCFVSNVFASSTPMLEKKVLKGVKGFYISTIGLFW